MTLPKRQRRRHSAAFKAMLIAQCREPGASVAEVAMAHQINANQLHNWLRLAEKAIEPASDGETISGGARIVPVQVANPVADVVTSPIRIHIQRGDTQIHVEWPMASAALCREWLQGWLR